jgi:hypothetical protein
MLTATEIVLINALFEILNTVLYGTCDTMVLPIDTTTNATYYLFSTACLNALNSQNPCNISSPPAGCTLSQGYWKTHNFYEDKAPKNQPWPLLEYGQSTKTEDIALCNMTYLEILHTPPAGGVKWYILAHQYIAAILNIANGASTTPDLESALDSASLLLEDNCDKNISDSTQISVLAALIDDYNNGITGPEPCYFAYDNTDEYFEEQAEKLAQALLREEEFANIEPCSN